MENAVALAQGTLGEITEQLIILLRTLK